MPTFTRWRSATNASDAFSCIFLPVFFLCLGFSIFPSFLSCFKKVLLEPNKHVGQVSKVFEKLMEITTGLTVEEMSQPAFVGLAMLRHPELHDVRCS